MKKLKIESIDGLGKMKCSVTIYICVCRWVFRVAACTLWWRWGVAIVRISSLLTWQVPLLSPFPTRSTTKYVLYQIEKGWHPSPTGISNVLLHIYNQLWETRSIRAATWMKFFDRNFDQKLRAVLACPLDFWTSAEDSHALPCVHFLLLTIIRLSPSLTALSMRFRPWWELILIAWRDMLMKSIKFLHSQQKIKTHAWIELKLTFNLLILRWTANWSFDFLIKYVSCRNNSTWAGLRS